MRPLRRVAVAGSLSVGLAIALALNGCGNRTRILHGERFSSDGTVLLLAARLPSCGCVTIGNKTKGRPEGPKTLRVKAFLYGRETGYVTLKPDDPAVRVRFDWASLQTGNAYQLAVYDEETIKPGTDPEALRPIWDYLYVDERSVIESSCRDQSCAFGDLAMNQAFNAMLGQGSLDVRRRGVNFTSAGLQLEVASRFADPVVFDRTYQCGCMILRNTSKKRIDVEIRATLGGEQIGTLKLPHRQGGDPGQALVAFDWAGPTNDDVYLLTAASIRDLDRPDALPSGTGDQVPAGAAGQPEPGAAAAAASPGTAGVAGTSVQGTTQTSDVPGARTTALRLADYVTVVGQIDLVKCTEAGSVFPVPGQLIALHKFEYAAQALKGQIAGTKAFMAEPNIFQGECPFGSLNMRRAQYPHLGPPQAVYPTASAPPQPATPVPGAPKP